MRIGSRVTEMIESRVTVWTQHQPNCIKRYRLWLHPTDDRSGRGRRWQQRNISKISFVRDHPFRTSFVTHLCLSTFAHIAPHQRCSINYLSRSVILACSRRLPNPIFRRAACKCPQSSSIFNVPPLGLPSLQVFQG